MNKFLKLIVPGITVAGLLVGCSNPENFESSKKIVYDLPKNDFFVSIAPFVNKTHPCTNHSLTSCQGEMIEEEFDVYIEDMKGNVTIDETMKSQSWIYRFICFVKSSFYFA